MQYWINHNGVQSGPVDVEGLKSMALTSRAYVWHEGLSDWVKITQLPELQGLYEMVDEPAVQGQPLEAATQQSTSASAATTWQSAQGNERIQEPASQEPCPPTNLVWAILACVFCCIPFGIVGIIYASKVSKCYFAGDLVGAKRASETGAWWIIAAMVIGVVWRPIVMSLMGA